MEQFVVQSVRPAWRFVLIDWHRRIVGKVGVVQHFEHFVSSHLIENLKISGYVYYMIASKSIVKVLLAAKQLFSRKQKLTDKNGALMPLTSSNLTPP